MRNNLIKIKIILNYINLFLCFLFSLLSLIIFFKTNNINQTDFIKDSINIPYYIFFSIFPILILTIILTIIILDLFIYFYKWYIIIKNENGAVAINKSAIQTFIHDTISKISGIENCIVNIDIMNDNKLNIQIWLNTNEKNDFIRFAERIQQRIVQDLEFNFGIKKINLLNVNIESTNIYSNDMELKINYK